MIKIKTGKYSVDFIVIKSVPEHIYNFSEFIPPLSGCY